MTTIEQNTERAIQTNLLMAIIRGYLRSLQCGRFGDPTLADLENAGKLHSFLEELYEQRTPKLGGQNEL